MNIEKAKNRLTEILRQWQDILAIEDETERDIESTAYIEDMPFNEIKSVLLELDKKDKIIELMARAIDNYDSQLNINTFKNKEHIIEYFTEYATEGE